MGTGGLNCLSLVIDAMDSSSDVFLLLLSHSWVMFDWERVMSLHSRYSLVFLVLMLHQGSSVQVAMLLWPFIAAKYCSS